MKHPAHLPHDGVSGGRASGRLSRRARGALACGAVVLALACPMRAMAACQTPVVSSYLDSVARDPGVVLRGSPRGGNELVYRVQMLATANISSLRNLMKAVPLANPMQKAAIGEGLGRAAGACISRYSDTTRRITDAVRQMGDRDVTRAFTAFLMPEGSSAATLPDSSSEAVPDGGTALPRDLSPRSLTLDDPFKAP